MFDRNLRHQRQMKSKDCMFKERAKGKSGDHFGNLSWVTNRQELLHYIHQVSNVYWMWKMIGGGRISYVIFVIAMMWSTFIFILYSNSSASCLAENERLRMAVERKDRFVELLRDQNDDLKKKVSRLQQEKRKDAVERSVQEKMYLVREVRLFQPNMNNDTTLKDR